MAVWEQAEGQQALAGDCQFQVQGSRPEEQIRSHEAVCCLHGERLPRAFQKQSNPSVTGLSLPPPPGYACLPALAPADSKSSLNPKLGSEALEAPQVTWAALTRPARLGPSSDQVKQNFR